MPNITMVWAIWGASYPAMYFRMWNQMDTSSRPSPTTVKPMTDPAEKATFSPRFKLSDAAWAVRALAEVATFMPTKPAKAEYTPPVRKAKGMNQLSSCRNTHSRSSTANTTRNTLNTVAY